LKKPPLKLLLLRLPRVEAAEEEQRIENIKDHLPQPTGWRIVVLPYRGAKKTKGGIELAEETLERQQLTTTCAYVLAVGPLAYKDTDKFPDGPWCKEGDWRSVFSMMTKFWLVLATQMTFCTCKEAYDTSNE
jgi:co-chaperonin GroES (HSP10)